MATFKNDPFPGTDYTQVQSWEKVTAPNGNVYYVVPGYPGYVYDPVASNATGKKVFRPNPSDSIKKQEDEKNRLDKAQKQDAQNKSPAGQLLPVVAGTAGSIAAYKYGIKGDPLFGSSTPAPAPKLPTSTTAPVPSAPAQGAAQGATSTPTGTPSSGTFNDSAPSGTGSLGSETPAFKPVGEAGPTTMQDGSPGTAMQDGGKIGTDGTIETPEGDIVKPQAGTETVPGEGPGTGFRVLQGVGGAAQVYNGYKQWKHGQKVSGAANIVGGAYNMYAAYQGGAASESAGQIVGTGVAAANIGQNIINTKGNSGSRAAQSETEAQKAALLYLGPYGVAAYAALSVGDAVTGGKFSQGITKFNSKTDNFNDKIDFGLGKSIRSKVFHQSTQGVQEEHTGQLAQRAPQDEEYLKYLGAMRGQVADGPKDPSKPFAGGKYKTFDEYEKAGLQANDLTGVYGNINVYGPDWAKLTEEQRVAVTQANINSGLYKSKKGEVYITDRDIAKANYKKVLGVDANPNPVPGTTTTAAPTAPGAPIVNGKGIAPTQTGANAVAPVAPVVAPTNVAKVAPLQPGQTATSTAGFATGGNIPIAPAPGQSPQVTAAARGSLTPQNDLVRTITLRPGIGLNGQRITYR